MDKEDDSKKFTVQTDWGHRMTFTLNENSTTEDARKYAMAWLDAAGQPEKIVKVWETET